jgi:hypothetical protein
MLRQHRHYSKALGKMNIINRFSLERHHGAYEEWPLRTRLYFDGKPTKVRVPGYSILHQFQIPLGYLLVTDCDCPFEETTSFILVSPTLRLLSFRMLFVPYGSFNLARVEWIDSATFWAVFFQEDYWRVTIRSWGIPFFRPRLTIRRDATRRLVGSDGGRRPNEPQA